MPKAASSSLFSVQYDAGLVEEAVFLRMRDHPEEALFHRMRTRIYERPELEEREKRFREFYGLWFSRQELGLPLTEALEEQTAILRQIRRCYVAPAAAAREEGADLHQVQVSRSPEGDSERIVLLRLRPENFLDPPRLRQTLRHELLHVADMLDPKFGYEPQLPASEAGPVYDNLIRDRYRVLWDIWIDGRLFRRGGATEQVRENHLAEFMRVFPLQEREAEEKVRRLFESEGETHQSLLAFATNPGADFAESFSGEPRARFCPLCRLPAFELVRDISDLPAEAVQELAADFPHWRPEHGLCRQCADLYRARPLSRSEAALLPGI